MSEILTIDANKLESLDYPQQGQSFIMVNSENNNGLSIDYDRLAEAILSRIVSHNITNDSLKFIIIDD